MATAEQPGVVADVVLKAANAARPKLRYTAGGLASRLQLTAKDRRALAALVDQLPEALDTAAVARARALLNKTKSA